MGSLLLEDTMIKRSHISAFLGLIVATLAMVTSTPLEIEGNRAAGAALMRKVKVLDRNMHNWWAEFKSLMKAYQDDFNADLACSNKELLEEKLNSIDKQVQKVRDGWTEKNNQLAAIRAILEDERFVGVTGLQDVLGKYITEQENQAKAEDTKLKAEELEVVEERNRLRDHPCPCVLSEWGEWSKCTVSCNDGENGGGTTTRTRKIIKKEINNGKSCSALGGENQSKLCSQDLRCPIDCTWSQWTAWSDCDKQCGVGHRHSTREKTGPFFKGAECVGEASRKQSCDLMADLKLQLQTCKAENKRLKEQVNCDVSKCKITVYQDCKSQTMGCGVSTVTKEQCSYLPDGMGETECASSACPAISGSQADLKTANCLNGVAIEITGGCHAYLAKDDHEYGQIFQPGFTGMWGLAEHVTGGVDTNIFQNFNKAKLFCKTGQLKDPVPDSSCKLSNIDYPGHDIFPGSKTLDSWEACELLCHEHAECKAFTYVTENFKKATSRKMCYIKRGIPAQKHLDNVISGIKGCGRSTKN